MLMQRQRIVLSDMIVSASYTANAKLMHQDVEASQVSVAIHIISWIKYVSIRIPAI